MESEIIVVFSERGGPVSALGDQAYPSQEEAAGAAAAYLRRSGRTQGDAINRAIQMMELNVGTLHLMRQAQVTIRLVYAHRLADRTLVIPNLRVRTAERRYGTVLAQQFMATSSAGAGPDGPGWIGGRDGWLYVRWDDGKSEGRIGNDQVRASALYSGEGA